MEKTSLNPKQLHEAADRARELDELLGECGEANLLPLMIGFDLDYLADQFDTAAVELETRTAKHSFDRAEPDCDEGCCVQNFCTCGAVLCDGDTVEQALAAHIATLKPESSQP